MTLPKPLLNDVRALGINLSQACERGLVAAQRRASWLDQNKQAIDAWNEHVEGHGLRVAEFADSVGRLLSTT